LDRAQAASCYLVNFDANHDALALQDVSEGATVRTLVHQRFFEQDGAADVVTETCVQSTAQLYKPEALTEIARPAPHTLGGEEQIAVRSAVILVVGNLDALEALADGASTLISSKNTLAG